MQAALANARGGGPAIDGLRYREKGEGDRRAEESAAGTGWPPGIAAPTQAARARRTAARRAGLASRWVLARAGERIGTF
ncbi:hypothetical protein C7T35_04115 [Variovorax sp. WS11]|nr:hypothetical protein C7T35_04115 [Variovorax sp. WS11]